MRARPLRVPRVSRPYNRSGRNPMASAPSMAHRWLRAARVSEIPRGKMKRVEIEGRQVLLANVEGRIYAAEDTCTHEEASLSRGALHGEYVQCPLHGSRFNVCTGAVMEEPAEEDLKTYAVRTDGEDVLIEME
jgi:nitrite reductase/ring-hydroxylating ferredoxin subunit